MADVIFNSFKRNILVGGIRMDLDTIKVMLVKSGYIPDQDAHSFKSTVESFEVSGPGYTAGGKALLNKTILKDDVNDKAKFDADDVSWPASTLTARFAVLYKDTGVSTTSPLICCFDFGADKSSLNHEFIIQWNAEGIVNLG